MSTLGHNSLDSVAGTTLVCGSMKYYRKHEVMIILRRRLGKRKQRDFARELGISEQFLTDVLRGRRDPGDKMLACLGLQREWVAIGKQ